MTGTNVRWLPLEGQHGTLQRVVVPVALLVALSNTLVKWALTAGVGVGIRPVGLVIVATAVVVGRPARWGSAAGLLVTGSLLSGWTYGVVWAVSAFATAAVADRLWVRDARDRDGGAVDWYLRYCGATLGGVVVLATTSAWLLDVLGQAAFSLTVGPTLVATLPLAIAGGPLVRLAVTRTDWSRRGGREPAPSATARRIALLVTICWAVFGYVGSFLFRVTDQMAPTILARQFPANVLTFIHLWGDQGTYAQALLGVVSLALLWLLLRRRRSRRGLLARL
jgi:LPXTG-motif cell wall-anchored protein